MAGMLIMGVYYEQIWAMRDQYKALGLGLFDAGGPASKFNLTD